jgi:NAD(P)-dependent dehydrogenase (short-subunit alcohol dehydrogenase family)
MLTAKLAIPDIAGKAILSTGASTGIGAALARAFADQGASIEVRWYQGRANRLRLSHGQGPDGDPFVSQKGSHRFKLRGAQDHDDTNRS